MGVEFVHDAHKRLDYNFQFTMIQSTQTLTRNMLLGAIGVLFGMVILAHFGLSLEGFVRAALCLFFMLVAVLDYDTQRIPNVLILPVGALALLAGILQRDALVPTLLGGAFAFVPFALVGWLRPHDLGGGDIKLAAVMGLVFGFPTIIWVLLFAVFAGGLVALALLITKRGTAKMQIPYGPFLCAGAFIAAVAAPLVLFL